MDTHVLRSLEFDQIKQHLLPFCLSDLGKSAVDQMTIDSDIHVVNGKLQALECMIRLFQQEHFPSGTYFMLDHELARSRHKESCLDAMELFRVGITLSSIHDFIHFMKGQTKEKGLDVFQDYYANFTNIEPVFDPILTAIDREGEIQDSASKTLREIRTEIRTLRGRIERKLRDFLNQTQNKRYIRDGFITKRQDRYVIPIIADYKGRLSGIVLDSSSSGETIFFEPEHIVNDNNELMKHIHEEEREKHRIRLALTKPITESWLHIQANLSTFGAMDCLYAKCRYALEQHAVKPIVNDDGYFELLQVYHPLLLIKHQKEQWFYEKEGSVGTPPNPIIPIDLKLGSSYQILVITGPNTGGKTVSLKTLGLLTLMTMAGMYLPAQDGCKISLVDSIFMDIGDEQSIQQNLSTFSGHIKRISEIIKNATPKSLILIDEIGAGTDPKEGGALGMAILHYILELGARAVVTTHFEPIKNLSLTDQRIENASCDFDVETLSPTYQLLYGITGESKAITIAKRLGLDERVIAKSLSVLSGEKNPQIVSIEEMNLEKEKYIRLFKRNKSRETFLDQKDQALKEKETRLIEWEKMLRKKDLKQVSDWVKDARRTLKHIVDQAKSEIKVMKDTWNEAYKAQPSKPIVQTQPIEKIQAIQDLETFAEPIQEEMILIHDEPVLLPNEEVSSDTPVEIGATVKIKGLDQKGVVQSIHPKKNEAQVKIGVIKFMLPLSDLMVIKPTEGKKAKDVRWDDQDSFAYSVQSSDPPSFELNVIGMYGQQALQLSERYVEDLYAHGKESGRIIHGIGMGTLRTLITNMLHNHPLVKSTNYAKLEMGGYGVTEFWLK